MERTGQHITSAVGRILRDASERRIGGECVFLTPLQMEHVYTHFRWNNDPELNRLDSELPFQHEPFGAFLKRFEPLTHTSDMRACDLEIHAYGSGLIGVAFIDRIQPQNRQCRVGITIGEAEYRGRGYGRATLSMLLNYLFLETGMHRINAEAFEFNTAWQCLLEGAGFRQEGCLRAYLNRDGKFWDKRTYALLDTEFKAHPRLGGVPGCEQEVSYA